MLGYVHPNIIIRVLQQFYLTFLYQKNDNKKKLTIFNKTCKLKQKIGDWKEFVSNELATSNGSHNFEKILNEDVIHVLHVTRKMFYSWPIHVKDFF